MKTNMEVELEPYTHRVQNSEDSSVTSSEVYRAKSIVERERENHIIESWKPSHEQLLYIWSEKSAGYRWLHMRCHEEYLILNNVCTYPIIILSCMVSFVSVIMPQNINEHDSTHIFMYIISGCNFLMAIITSIQKFHRYAENSEKHYNIAIQYAMFYREINMELALDKKDRKDAVEFCKLMKANYDRMLMSTMIIPNHIIKLFNQSFPYLLHRPDVANGLFDMHIKRDEYI